MKNYQELKTWQQGIEIVKGIFRLTEALPKTEKYGLISQMTRAAVSIPANIAEGSSRNSDKDYARFLQIALGSSFELQTYLVLIKELGWISSGTEDLELLLEQEIKMIHAFIKAISQ
ncbi:four helix bundle protein [Pedobacter sp. BS3]|uniref:four helix bundle protein n=1 Tax=Pedobacter sp. BS3 TaxID=2567937 RepID=UPI0011ED93CE|nr:four helix bundle protein [Pedobacter sp. BS3]TZF83703.1 four helix bundle protein [Pedobacter sp. BS3]